MSESDKTRSSMPCVCSSSDSTLEDSLLDRNCECRRDDFGIVIHDKTCLMYRSETIIYPHDPACDCKVPVEPGDGTCLCCNCPIDQCRCKRSGREAFDKWRSNRDISAMPAVLESTHPLMQKFQETLKQFLLKENAIAEDEILTLREELRLSKKSYDSDLEDIYRNDNDTNAQRVLIEEYDASLAQRAMEREAAEKRARELNEKYKKAREKLDENMIRERETTQEMEALNALCNQLKAWRTETETDLTVSQRISDKMKIQKRTLADEKRQLDMFLFGLTNEVWKLESKLEMFKKQMEIKNVEMEKINDKVAVYSAELEDLDLDKRRLVSLWNSVIVNIQQRDKVYDSVRDDYKTLRDHYVTIVNSLEATKKVSTEEMHIGKAISMSKDKLLDDINIITLKHVDADTKKQNFQTHINQMIDSIEMNERDQEMIKQENQAMGNILASTVKELERKSEYKMKLENEVLLNLQDSLLNDKAVEHMANGIRKMRELTRKQETCLTSMENQHALVMLDIEVERNRHIKNNKILKECLASVTEKEKELEMMQSKYNYNANIVSRKQRELDIMKKKFFALKEIYDMKSPQERRIDELEKQIKELRERTETIQNEWLRQQGIVVNLANQHHIMVTETNLIKKQIQICEQKTMRNQADSESLNSERMRVERTLRTLRGRLQLLEHTRKDANERNEQAHLNNMSAAYEYAANLKDAETEIIDIEEEIEELEKDKVNLTQELDRVQREALIWQRKGILAVELKKNMKDAMSAAGEVGQMKVEIHRMEVRRDELRRTGDKLAEDLALYVTRRDNAMDKSRATAAVEKTQGASTTSQTVYHHKLRLAKADVIKVTKDIAEAKANIEQLQKEQEHLDLEVEETGAMNKQLQETIAELIRETRLIDRNKHWLLERVVRAQRFGQVLTSAIKRQSVRTKKPKDTILAEHQKARDLNERLRFVVGALQKDYPHLEDKLQYIENTLNIFSPENSPQLAQEGTCTLLKSGECALMDQEIVDEVRASSELGIKFPPIVPAKKTLE